MYERADGEAGVCERARGGAGVCDRSKGAGVCDRGVGVGVCDRADGDGVVGRDDIETDLMWTELYRESGDWVVELYWELPVGDVGGGLDGEGG